MADTVQKDGRASLLNPVNTARISTRSTRKKKTQYLSPKKFVDLVTAKTKQKSFEAGVAEIYKETYLESPTFGHYFKTANKDKNVSERVWLYDATRVIVPDVDYIHASWVEGLTPGNPHYVLAQAPHNAITQKNFFKMLAHVKAEVLFVIDVPDDIASFISPKLGDKKSCEKAEDVTTLVVTDMGVTKLKVARMNKWPADPPRDKDGKVAKDTPPPSPIEVVDMMEKARKFFGSPVKGTVVITCKDGATRSGVIAFLDIEMDRLAKNGKVKHNETIKQIRFQRSNAFDEYHDFNLALLSITEVCSRCKKK